jgi:hypothetical protein
MQFCQRRNGHPRNARRHPGTGGRIEHPSGHDDHHARRRFDVNDVAVGAPLDILATNPPAMERMPEIADLNVLPDMGRMTTRLPSAGSHGSSPAPIAAAKGPPSCTA